MGKHCLHLLPLFSPYAWRFSEQTDEKNHAEQCLALYSRLGLSAIQTSEPTSKTRGNTYPSCFVLM